MRYFITILSLVATTVVCHAQISGNVGFGRGGSSGRTRAELAEQAKRLLSDSEKPVGNGMFLDAAILINVKADDYVAVIALSREAPTVAECNAKMDVLISDLAAAFKAIGVSGENIAVDFIAQNKTYGYQIEGGVAKEKLLGFDLKKNMSLRFKDVKTLDKIMVAAASLQVFDLVKVDYLVKDHEAVQDKLIDEAARVIKLKAARHEKLLGVKLGSAQVHVERTSVYQPSEMYDSYVAQESEHVEAPIDRQRYLVQGARKGRTFYYNPLTASGFDAVINPIISEPVVQFTSYVRVRYEIEAGKAKASK